MTERDLADRRGMMALGVVLVVLGVAALAGRSLGYDILGLGWPLFVIVPGILLLVVAISTGGAAGSAVAVPGGIVLMTGLVLAVQNATGLWATWAYAWALVAPGGVGTGLLVYGLATGQREFVGSGLPILGTGLALFLVFGLLFEGVFGLSGTAFVGAETLLAVGLVAVGAAILLASLRGRSTSA